MECNTPLQWSLNKPLAWSNYYLAPSFVFFNFFSTLCCCRLSYSSPPYLKPVSSLFIQTHIHTYRLRTLRMFQSLALRAVFNGFNGINSPTFSLPTISVSCPARHLHSVHHFISLFSESLSISFDFHLYPSQFFFFFIPILIIHFINSHRCCFKHILYLTSFILCVVGIFYLLLKRKN